MGTRFAGRRALVTGGTRGIGLAVAAGLVAEGASVAIVGRSLEHLSRALSYLRGLGGGGALVVGRAATIGADASVHQALAAFAAEQLGGVDYLVNAAGGARVTAVLEASWDLWQAEMAVKFWGYLGMMRAVVPWMEAGTGPRAILNILGVTGKDPNPALAIAGAANAALRAVTKSLAQDLAPRGIRVVNINPGATETDLLQEMAAAYAARCHATPEEMLRALRQGPPLGRLPTAPEVAELALFLLSDAALPITGTSIDIDGGAHHGLA
ncbi:MAG: SDR family oxidoreductase [Firmicutes bacterium]|nr:SDR family oxidoreductase [Alicyclobacillaceae bacterium]MCL6496534.1 SDR family oxidoreductase [Bacillota bacterium]